MERKGYSETRIVRVKDFEILERMGIISSAEEINKKLEELAEKLEKSDRRRIWLAGKEDCVHQWNVRREIEGVEGEYQKIMEFLECAECGRTIFYDGWRNETGGWQIQIETDGSEGMAIPPG